MTWSNGGVDGTAALKVAAVDGVLVGLGVAVDTQEATSSGKIRKVVRQPRETTHPTFVS